MSRRDELAAFKKLQEVASKNIADPACYLKLQFDNFGGKTNGAVNFSDDLDTPLEAVDDLLKKRKDAGL